MLDYKTELERINRRRFFLEMAAECYRLAESDTQPDYTDIYGMNKPYSHTNQLVMIYHKQCNDLNINGIVRFELDKLNPCTIRDKCDYLSYNNCSVDTYRCIKCHNNRSLTTVDVELPIEIYRTIFSHANVNPMGINRKFRQLVYPVCLNNQLVLACGQVYVSYKYPQIDYYSYAEPEQGLDIVVFEICEVRYKNKYIIAFQHKYEKDYKGVEYFEYEIAREHKQTRQILKTITVHGNLKGALQECCNDIGEYFGYVLPKEQTDELINKNLRNEFEKRLKSSLVFKLSYLTALAHLLKDSNHNIDLPVFEYSKSVNNSNTFIQLKEIANELELKIRDIMGYL